MKSVNNIVINPSVVSQEEYDQTIAKFQQIIDQFGADQANSEQIRSIVENSWLTKASLYELQQDFSNAQKIYDEIIQLNPTNKSLCASAQFSKALLYERLNQLDTALVEYQTFLSNYNSFLKSPDSLKAGYLETPLKIAKLHRFLNKKNVAAQYKKTRDLYMELASVHSNEQIISSIYQLVAASYSDDLDWNRVIETLSSLNAEYPDTTREPFILFEIANIYNNQLAQNDKALTIYNQIITHFPNHQLNATNYLNIGNIYIEDNLYSNARESYKKVIEKHENNLMACAKAQFGIGLTYEREGEMAVAINEYEWISDKYPLSLEAVIIPNYIANYYKRSNMENLANKAFQDAIENYQSFIELYKDNEFVPFAKLQLAVAFRNLAEWEKAINAAVSIITDHPNNIALHPDVYLMVGDIYEKELKQKEQAIQQYQTFLNRFPNHPQKDLVAKRLTDLE
jgi:tetratricopeptide (TPR) repeat protein